MPVIDLTGRTVVVAGGSSGIGLTTVKLLLEAGAAVALCGRNVERLAQAEQGLCSHFPNARLSAATCDVLDAAQVAAPADAVEQAVGLVNMLVNNAGQDRVSTFADTDDATWTQELHLEFFFVIHPTHAFMPQFERSVHGAIVCVNSLLAQQPEPYMVAASATRAGVLSFMRSMATEFAPKGVRANGILIGLVESGQWRRHFEARPEEDHHPDWAAWTHRLAAQKHIPLGRLGLSEEAARAILLLASPLSSYTTGSHIDIFGGRSRHA